MNAMLARLEQHAAEPTEQALRGHLHVLFVLPRNEEPPDSVPAGELLRVVMKRRGMKPEELAKTPVSASLQEGALAAWLMLDLESSVFEQQSAMRKALQLLLSEHPAQIAVVVQGTEEERRTIARHAVYCAWVNGAKLPIRKKQDEAKPLEKIVLYGFEANDRFADLNAQAEGNLLVRELTLLPPNELTPGIYRERIRELAAEAGFEVVEHDYKNLREMGAGAFCAVAQGSPEEDAAIVRVSYRHASAQRTVALAGKGICFDTGGHNLKPARYMLGMHKDMNGSAVCLGILVAATRLKLPLNLDAWLALAQNHLSPSAYKQNEVVTALDGTTIEIVHTDAEGRMVLADTLALAAREKPQLIVDFATLTGSMHVALGERYSGVMSNRDEVLEKAVGAGRSSGERVCAFPLDADYDQALESKIADVKQCTLEGNADHILAARFLSRFVNDLPWIHVDLAASSCEGGLGAVASDVTGFGVGWGLALLGQHALLEGD
jgi:leucyl aminopeptidase